MNRKKLRTILIGAGLVLGLGGAGLALRAPGGPSAAPTATVRAPDSVEPFDLARILSQSPPDMVVIALDPAEHPMRGAMPSTAYGSDDTLLEAAPRARRIVLAGKDPVRTDRIARALLGSGREVSVLAGGIDAWDRAMEADPPAPGQTAGAAVWDEHRTRVALRRYFGDSSAALEAAPPAAEAPVAPAAPAMAAPKKREGC